MKVLFAASEAAPFAKSGGLGDVIGSLPAALKQQDIDVRVMVPKYGDIPEKYKKKMKHINSFKVSVAWREKYCGIEEYIFNGVTFYFIDNEFYFKRSGLYGYYDEAERFVFFSKAVLDSLYYIDFKPDIIHCHDWQTAIIPFLLKENYKDSEYHSTIKTVFTIHNLKYQGRYGKEILGDIIGVEESFARNNAFEFYDDINLMKSAFYYSDKVTTVSSTYAEEIQNSYYGEGLQGTLREINYKLKGIINGLDYNENNYSIKDKKKDKKMLQNISGLPQKENVPILSIVTRLVEQKGLDLLADIIYEVLNMDVELIILGTGEEKYEDLFKDLQNRFPNKVRAFIQFDIDLANAIYKGSDMFLMPSLFEPCGLAQMISLQYGTIPIVRETGGLKDTIIPYNEYEDSGTGFSFARYNANDLYDQIYNAIKIYNKKDKWRNLVGRGLKERFSWEDSAKLYDELYNEIVK